MHTRAKYVENDDALKNLTDEHVGTIKFDGANYWATVQPDGSLTFISRRPSVKGGYPDRTSALPHLKNDKLKEYAGHILNVELIHTGKSKDHIEHHGQLSGILNSLPPKAIATQQALGPVRAVLHNVVHPGFKTYQEKLIHMKSMEQAFGNPDIFFVPELYVGKERIRDLIDKTKAEGREGAIVAHLTREEESNPRLKVKHRITHNLVVTGIQQAYDINGNPKPEMGALELSDATGAVVGHVGTGFSRAQRVEAFNEPEKWLKKEVQVTSMGKARNLLRMPVYNGESDGDIDTV